MGNIRDIIGDSEADAVLAAMGKYRRRQARRRPRVLSVGTISHGTLRMEDLIPALAGELDRLQLSRAERKAVREALSWDPDTGCVHGEPHAPVCADCETEPDDLYEALTEIADAHVPDYCYFGAHEGDGADIGVWVSWDAIDEAGFGKYPELVRSRKDIDARTIAREHPDATHALEVNDHGNATLYRKVRRGRGYTWREVWSVV